MFLTLIYILTGWDLSYPLPEEPTILVFQHSTAWELIIGLLAYPTSGVQAYLAMNEFQARRYGWILERLGVRILPVPMMGENENMSGKGSCQSISEKLRAEEYRVPQFMIAPDGRRDIAPWRSGWKTIANELNWPVRALCFDFFEHRIKLGNRIAAPHDSETERQVRQFFNYSVPLYPKSTSDRRPRSLIEKVALSALLSGILSTYFIYVAGFFYHAIWCALLTAVSTYYHLHHEHRLARLDLYMNCVAGLWLAYNSQFHPRCPSMSGDYRPRLFVFAVYLYFVFRAWGRCQKPERTARYIYYHMLSHLILPLLVFVSLWPSLYCLDFYRTD